MLAWVGDLVSENERQAVSRRLHTGTLGELLRTPLSNEPRHPFPEEVWTTSFDLVERKDELRRAIQGPAPPPALPAEDWEMAELTVWDWKEINKNALAPIVDILSDMQTPGWHVGNNPFQVELRPENCDAKGFGGYFDIVPDHIDLPTIRERVRLGQYRSVAEFAEHIHLMRENMVRFSSRMENLDKAADMLLEHWEERHNLHDRAQKSWRTSVRDQKIKARNRERKRAQEAIKRQKEAGKSL